MKSASGYTGGGVWEPVGGVCGGKRRTSRTISLRLRCTTRPDRVHGAGLSPCARNTIQVATSQARPSRQHAEHAVRRNHTRSAAGHLQRSPPAQPEASATRSVVDRVAPTTSGSSTSTRERAALAVLGASRLIASRVVFRHRARARHRGIEKNDQRTKSATSPRPHGALTLCVPRSVVQKKAHGNEFPVKRRLAAGRSHSPLAAPLAARRFPLAPPPVFPLALFMFRLGTRVAHWEQLRPLGVATRSHAGAATRQRDLGTREAPRGGEGDDSLLRVARAGADSPLRDAPRHYRVRRHFLRGPFLPRCIMGSVRISTEAQSAGTSLLGASGFVRRRPWVGVRFEQESVVLQIVISELSNFNEDQLGCMAAALVSRHLMKGGQGGGAPALKAVATTTGSRSIRTEQRVWEGACRK
eukprot:scaffold22485_cov70-Phaeocystis_antarctica.AAC.4